MVRFSFHSVGQRDLEITASHFERYTLLCECAVIIRHATRRWGVALFPRI